MWREQPGRGRRHRAAVQPERERALRADRRQRRLGAVIFLEDQTRVQAQARQLKLAAIGRLTANIAHEISNPLGAISHAAELMQEEPAINDTTRRLLTIIHENSQRLDRMVNDVLRLNRGERAHRERFKLVDFLKTFVEQFCPDREGRPRDLRDRARRRPRGAVRPQPSEPGDVEPVPQRAAPLPARAREHPHPRGAGARGALL